MDFVKEGGGDEAFRGFSFIKEKLSYFALLQSVLEIHLGVDLKLVGGECFHSTLIEKANVRYFPLT